MQVAKLFELPLITGPQQLFGIECEVESLDTRREWNVPDGVEIHEDGSLRNNGREFVTDPSNITDTLCMFSDLYKGLKFVDASVAFSPRTSLHVHVNCLDLDELAVKRIVMFYALFEEAFFKIVHQSRRDNIHCVALTETFLPAHYHMALRPLVGRWSKYTALNLLPLSKLGTLEFRHMHGHNDVPTLAAWLGVLDRLFILGKTTELDARSLTQTNILTWFSFLFGPHPEFARLYPQLSSITRNSLIDVKLGM